MRILFVLSALPAVVVASHSVSQHHHEQLLRAGGAARLLEISEECLDDTQNLYASSSSLEGAYAAMEQEVSETEDLLSCENFTCTVDFSTLETAPEYKSECEAAGGTILERHATMSCTTFLFEYNNMMECTAPSCNPENIDAELTKSMQETEETVESTTGATCSSELSDSGGGSTEPEGTSSGLSGGAIFGIVVAILAVLGAAGYVGFKWYKKQQEEEGEQVKPGAVEEQAKLASIKKQSTGDTVAKQSKPAPKAKKLPLSASNGTRKEQPIVASTGVTAELEA